jgi:hypothetical protein
MDGKARRKQKELWTGDEKSRDQGLKYTILKPLT